MAERPESRRGLSPAAAVPPGSERILTVSQITAAIQERLGTAFPGVWVRGELTNVRRLGRMQYRLTQQQFDDAVDDLARYMLGADDEFEKVARGGK